MAQGKRPESSGGGSKNNGHRESRLRGSMFQAVRAHETHTIEIPIPLDRCFSLFTPLGETRWVPDWAPAFVYPASGEAQEGMVFVTSHGDETTFWTLVDYDPDRHYARYSRVTPGSRSTIVEVRCSAGGDGRTSVTVDYTLTGLSEAGNHVISEFCGDAYRTMIEHWRTLIEQSIAPGNV
jgi:hypothetical protein